MRKRTYLALLLLLMVSGSGQSEPAKSGSEKLDGEQIQSAVDSREVFVLDVREAHEIAESGTVPDAYHIPSGEIADRLDELPKDRPILVA